MKTVADLVDRLQVHHRRTADTPLFNPVFQLSLDLSRMCSESGCGALIDVEHVPIAAAATELATAQQRATNGPGRQTGVGSPTSGGGYGTALDHALADGEDFELILAVPPDEGARMIAEQPLSGVRLSDIGEFVADRGLWQRDATGVITPLPPRGWEH